MADYPTVTNSITLRYNPIQFCKTSVYNPALENLQNSKIAEKGIWGPCVFQLWDLGRCED
jgi:hypothetical protein